MIIGFDITAFDLIRKFAHTTTKFYLTGSRYFGYAKADSDWDFFTNADEATKFYLQRIGFKRIPMKPEWLDEISCGVYRHPCQVEVALVDNINLKKQAQHYIREVKPILLERMKQGQNPKDIWNEAYIQCLKSEL